MWIYAMAHPVLFFWLACLGVLGAVDMVRSLGRAVRRER